MRPSSLASLLCGCSAATASVLPSQSSEETPADGTALRIPTSYESAVLGRRILALTPIGTLATVFPDDAASAENRPAGVGGMPLSLMDYIADCSDTGDPTILALTVETHFRNVRAGSNISLAVRWTPPYPPAKRIMKKSAGSHLLQSLLGRIGWTTTTDDEDDGPAHESESYSAANLPRFSLLGYVEPIPGSDDRSDPSSVGARLAACYTAAHPDARYWLPGNRIHEAHFVRLVVTRVYWVGGFGDRAYIGWIPAEQWRNVTREEWQGVRLPGEKKGWKEWAVGYTLGEQEL